MHIVHNARITLLANLLNAMAGSSFTVGVAAPIAATFFYNPARLGLTTVLIGVAAWIAVAAVLHVLAQFFVGGLRQ